MSNEGREKANASNHDTSPLGRNRMSLCPIAGPSSENDKIPITSPRRPSNKISGKQSRNLRTKADDTKRL